MTGTSKSAQAESSGGPRLELSRDRILAHRRRVGGLDERLPPGPESLRRAAWAGLQDSVPRAALLSIHARVAGTQPSTWEEGSLVQLWGLRFAVYVVAAVDAALFSLSRLPVDPAGRQRAEGLFARLDAFLEGRRMSYGEAGHALGVNPNMLRYAAETGRVLIRWDGARSPAIWTVAAPKIGPTEARMELARRYLHVFGPGTPAAFGRWAGIETTAAREAFTALSDSLTPVRTPLGAAWILAEDEGSFRAPAATPAPARFLPSGDAYTLLWGPDRELLVPDAKGRAAMWTPRVWPGALLVDGELAGTWRRSEAAVSIQAWRPLSRREREAVEEEAASMPLPGLRGPIVVRWLE